MSDVVKTPEAMPSAASRAGEADPYGWVERCVWTERMVDALRRGGPEGGRWFAMQDKVFAARTLRQAYASVASNAGAPGIDGVTVDDFGGRLESEIARLHGAWQAKTYRPQAVRRVHIPKPGTSETRPLGIPTVADRVVQTALRMVIEPIFEVGFSGNSYGFRPGRSAHDALRATLDHLKAGLVHVVDADLKGYFDTIPHDQIMGRVRRKISDGRVLDLIESLLKAKVMEGMEAHEPDAGTPQGGVISPLLANIYLDDLDHLMAGRGWAMVRYADDFVILCRSREEAERALASVRAWTVEAGLTLHPTKTRLVDLSEHRSFIDFLGFRFQRQIDRDGTHRFLRLVRPKSRRKIEEAIRQRTRRAAGESMADIIAGLNQALRGWYAYFRSVHRTIHVRIDQMTRRRLRAILQKNRGVTSWGGGQAHNRWPNGYFTERGLFSLEAAHVNSIHSPRGTR